MDVVHSLPSQVRTPKGIHDESAEAGEFGQQSLSQNDMQCADVSKIACLREIPSDLLTSLEELDNTFTVDVATLRKITDHLVAELEKGLMVSPYRLRRESNN
ncbi:hypothetical protein MAP00_006775 [Monascus purpureus]|nr:hypothetical protein MAP00_006775 [Monascus purpureus]